MNIFTLKIIALTTMIIDHFAFLNIPFDAPTYFLIRGIGRIAFPLYLFIITESLYYTKNRQKFISSLLLLSFVSQLPFFIYFNNSLSELNVLFTLFFGSFIVYNIDNYKTSLKNKDLIKLTTSMLLPLIFKSDFGFIGAYSIVILYYIRRINDNNLYSSLFLSLLAFSLYSNNSLFFFFALIPAILILFYNKKEGKKLKQFFRLSYPLHLLFYIIINTIFLS